MILAGRGLEREFDIPAQRRKTVLMVGGLVLIVEKKASKTISIALSEMCGTELSEAVNENQRRS
jgi:hypothetical protein